MTSLSRLVYLLAFGVALGACKDSADSGDDGPQCIGAKCDDVDDPTASASAGDSGPIEPPPDPRADLGVSPPAHCETACEVLASCLGETLTDCQLECTVAHEEATTASAACATAYDGLLSCIAGLDCQGAADYQTAAEGYPCATEEDAALVACSAEPQTSECDGFCALAVMCDGGDAETCTALCGEALANADGIGADCKAAQLATFECVGALGCDEYAAWSAAEGEDYPCVASDTALVGACTQAEGEG
jgi:hypothetical protein